MMKKTTNKFGVEITRISLNVDTNPGFSPFSGKPASRLLEEMNEEGWQKRMPCEVVFASVGTFVVYAHPWVLLAMGRRSAEELESFFPRTLNKVLAAFRVPEKYSSEYFSRHLVAVSTVGDCETISIVYAPDLVKVRVNTKGTPRWLGPA